MKTIKKILVPIDFSKFSTFACTHAQELAKTFGARVDMIHVVPLLTYFSESLKKLGVPLNMEKDLYPHVKDGAEHQLEGLMDDYFQEENKGNPVILIHRKPSKAIAGYAEEHNYDLIVMAARGEHSSDLFRGSVNEQVIRYAETPVLTVDSRLRTEVLKRILVPTDASPVSFACFPMALTLAEAYGAEIILFHVPELYGSLSDRTSHHHGVPVEAGIYRSVVKSLINYIEEEGLQNYVSISRKGNNYSDNVVLTRDDEETVIPLQTVIRKGVSAHYGIEEYAPEHADLIVMTTHGHKGLTHLIMGSTAEMVAHNVKMPVVTVKASEQVIHTEE